MRVSYLLLCYIPITKSLNVVNHLLRFFFDFVLSDYIVMISCVILVVLFSLQHHGTHRVAFLFAPIVTAWLFCISGIGIYNIFHWNPQIFQALSPLYMLKFLRTTGVEGWVSLGGVALSMTGISFKTSDAVSSLLATKESYWKLPLSGILSQVWRQCLLIWDISLLSQLR